MATYFIGDIHGCFSTLQRLLGEFDHRPGVDRLISVGDLVNVGPDSRRVLRWAMENQVEAVLGNHDLHLLAVATGAEPMKKADTFGEILAASERDEYLHWLRHRPLFIRGQGFAVSHAGMLPGWSLARAEELAGEVEGQLRGGRWEVFLAGMYGDQPDLWDDHLNGPDRWRVIVNAFTRLRLLKPDGGIDQSFKAPPEKAPLELRPWYENNRATAEAGTYFFGHWAAHGARRVGPVVALDSGCAWGRKLTAARLDDGCFFSVPSELAGKGRRE